MLQPLQAIRKKRISDLEKARSRSPRRNRLALPAPSAPLALPAPPAPQQAQKGGKRSAGSKRGPRGKPAPGRVPGKTQTTGQAVAVPSSNGFYYIMSLPTEFRANFHEKFHKREICFKFQKNNCTGKCRFSHICVGCGGSKPYDECRCLTSKIH